MAVAGPADPKSTPQNATWRKTAASLCTEPQNFSKIIALLRYLNAPFILWVPVGKAVCTDMNATGDSLWPFRCLLGPHDKGHSQSSGLLGPAGGSGHKCPCPRESVQPSSVPWGGLPPGSSREHQCFHPQTPQGSGKNGLSSGIQQPSDEVRLLKSGAMGPQKDGKEMPSQEWDSLVPRKEEGCHNQGLCLGFLTLTGTSE